ncbi:DinB family protein [Tenacibaculum adriaticum]|uniref:DinB family protein n=1 Tax=Tenacibaculum adriaticum TaxID=413713 RepID=A0A5S5DSZ1_9FLAO|nr:putative metal-dependent hydrolase [Tenacibaculum adriaticum]TYP98804.1 DinB family protein [Tenacibaculum adriaticum]
MEHLKYPIGKPNIPENITPENVKDWTKTLEDFSEKLEKLVSNLTDEQLDTPYRDGGWTVRQVVHHCADSHHNSYTRFKWALTEDKPIIKAYFEDRWAELFDSKSAPIQLSLLHLKAIHAKLVYLIKGLTDEELSKSFILPESNKEVVLKENIGIYAWHCNHHYAHIENLLIRKGWK